ncbi:MAG: LCP family protein [Candidatus Magasanikbacteria bacterium]|nr:LCP family protein [Candidatus Magasanikbacteria bacterium]
MLKRIFFLMVILLVISVAAYVMLRGFFWFKLHAEVRATEQKRNAQIETVLESRKTIDTNSKNPFGDDERVKVLLIGLDKRVGQTHGHCDAIQFVDIDKKTNSVTITAVPRGTYSPLPPGTGVTSSDYYVSNACGLGGLAYGVTQIEYILGEKADYLVVLGFSEMLGILRTLKLPTTETLQWLRQRQGYAIGEPQRARNHSMFIKQTMIQYIPEKNSKIDTALQYIMYRMVQTDLSFDQVTQIVTALSEMNLKTKPENITLAMRPAYTVQDIPYDSEHLNENLSKMLDPIKHLLTSSYTGISEEQIQSKLMETINSKKNEPEFIAWAFDNDIWLQIEDDEIRKQTQFEFLENKLALIEQKENRKALIADYILEMQYISEDWWADKGKNLLEKEI